MVAALIVVISMGKVAYFPDTLKIIPGFEPVHLLWIFTVLVVIFERRSRIKPPDLPIYFTTPIKLFIVIYVLGFIMTFFGGADHPYYVSGNTLSNLFTYHGFVPAQIILTGWMAMSVTETKENLDLIKKSIFLGATITGLLISYYYFQGGALSGGWTTYRIGRDSIQSGIGLHSNHIAGISVYFTIASLLIKVKEKDSIFKYIAIGMSLLGTVFTFSRMAWYAVAAIILMLIPKMKWSMRIVLVIIMTGIWLTAHTQIKNRIRYGTDSQRSSQQELDRVSRLDRITAGRIYAVWLPAINQINEHLFIGTGVYSRVVTGWGAGNPHSAYLKVLLNHGLIGAFFMTILMISFIIEARKAKGVFFYSIIAMLLMGVVGHLFVPYRGNWPFWVLYGVSLNETRINSGI